MKRTNFFIFFCLIALTAYSQLSITGNHILIEKINGQESIKVIIFDSINSTTSINYDGTNIRFYTYNNLGSDTYSTTLFPPDDATGYVITEDGTPVDTIWVIDYQNYLPVINSLAAEDNTTEQCEQLQVLVDATIPPLSYESLSGNTYSLTREFKLTYQTLEWTDSWNTINVEKTITLPASNVTVDAPLCDTYFTLSGDQYAEELESGLTTFKSPFYSAVAVENNLISVLTARDEKNEANRPSSETQLSGSAPLEIQLLSNANEPVAKYYNWTIYKNGEMVINRADKDHRYTFSESGTYIVKLITSNEYCSDADSISITVSDSEIQVPNVFTPNGDGYNDEFRIAFKSIVKFDCWVYNRWGRLMFHWTDPTKGWDGTVNGKQASPGPYFYVIKAKGSDYDQNSKKNKTTNRRIGEYVLKGDINLLRGNK